MGSSGGGGGAADRQWVSEAERAEGEMDLRFLKGGNRDVYVHGDSPVVRDVQVMAS